MTDREPIVSAVLADPVVKAVLQDPSAAGAVADAAAMEASHQTSAPVPAVAETGTTATVQTPIHAGQSGGSAPDKPNVMILPGGQPIAAPTTTEEEDRATVGQRRINLLWETTQSIVAVTVTTATLYVAARLALKDNGDTAAFLLLSNVFFLVLGTYFNRTNHVKIGGVGKNEAGR